MNSLSRLARWLAAVLAEATESRPATGSSRHRARPCLEVLEDRCVPSTLSGFVYHDTNDNGVQDSGEAGLASVKVTLTGIDNQNHQVNVQQNTNSTGYFSFANLAPGTYTLQDSPANGYLDGLATAGTSGGVAGSGTLSSIVLAANTTGTGYNFGELAQADGWSAIQSNFNGTAIQAGSTLWFTSAFKINGLGSSPVTLRFTDQTITYTANGTPVTIDVPDSVFTFSPTATLATTTFDTANNAWDTTLPMHSSGNDFLGAVAVPLPAGLPGGINPVTWQGRFTSDATAGLSVNWQWATAVYTSFSSNYNVLNVKPVDDNQASSYKNSDDAGTPEAFPAFVTGGARGGGGSNFTGSLSGTASVTPPVSPPVPKTGSLSGTIQDVSGTPLSGVTVNLTGTDSQGHAVSLSTTTNSNGFYQFTGVAASNSTGYTIAYQDSTLPAGEVASSATVGTIQGNPEGSTSAADSIGQVVLDAGQNGINYDFTAKAAPSSLCGYITDSNSALGLNGVTVTLTGTDSQGHAVSLSTTTSSNGFYQFTGVAASNSTGYTIAYQDSTLPAGEVASSATVGTVQGNPEGSTSAADSIGQVVLDAAQNGINYDFTAKVTAPSSLSGYVQDVNGTPLSGVVVMLTGTDSQGHAVSLTATTDSNGFYQFTGLAASNSQGYRVAYQDSTLPSGEFADLAKSGTGLTSDGVSGSTGDSINMIVVGAGQVGINFDFLTVNPNG